MREFLQTEIGLQMEVLSGIGILDLYRTEDDLLSSYHPDKSDFVESLLAENKPKNVTCPTCFRQFPTLWNHTCMMIAADASGKLSDSQKDALRKFELYGCLSVGCAFRSNFKGA